MKIQAIYPPWLTNELRQQIRRVFEPKYNRKLSEVEVVLIADNLTQFMEGVRLRWNQKYGKQIETV